MTAHLPKNYQQVPVPEDVISRTSQVRLEVKGQNAADCKMSILTILAKKPLYGSTIFTNISVKTVRSTFTKCWLVVNSKGIALHDPHEKVKAAHSRRKLNNLRSRNNSSATTRSRECLLTRTASPWCLVTS